MDSVGREEEWRTGKGDAAWALTSRSVQRRPAWIGGGDVRIDPASLKVTSSGVEFWNVISIPRLESTLCYSLRVRASMPKG